MLTEVRGLVIRSVDINDSDRLITIFTRERGAVSALAKGARSLRSRKMSSTMQFCYANFVLYGSSDKLWVREAELIESFFDIRKSIEGLALAAYIAEVLSDVTVSVAECELLRLSLNSLYAIASGKYEMDKIKAAFEIRAASILGFMPDVLGCHVCGKKHGEFYLDIMGGEIECADCRKNREFSPAGYENLHEARIICPLSEGAKTALGYCIYSPIEKIFSFSLPMEDMRLFSKASEEYLINQLERSFRSLEFYKEVKR